MAGSRAVAPTDGSGWPGDGIEPTIEGHYSKLDDDLAAWLSCWTSWTRRNFRRGCGSRLELLPFAAYRTEAHDSIRGERFTSFSQSQAAEWIGCTKRNAVNVIGDMSTDDPNERPAPLTVAAKPPRGNNSWSTCYTFTDASFSDEANAVSGSPDGTEPDEAIHGFGSPVAPHASGELSCTSGELSCTSGEPSKQVMPGRSVVDVPPISPITPTPPTEQDSHGPAASSSDVTGLLGEGCSDEFEEYDE